MVKLNKIMSNAYTNSLGLVKRAKLQKMAEQIARDARELQMLPKYMELETVNGVNRFSQKEISELSKMFSEYDSELSKVDILKELLAAGKEKGMRLTPEMMKDFLEATSSMTGKEQQNVLKFLKSAAENIKLPENGSKAAAIKELNAINYINKQNPGIVEAIGKCSDPETAAIIIKETGVNFHVSEALDALTEAYKLSGNKTTFPIDLTRAFYPSEIKQIIKTLIAEGKLDKLKNYQTLTYDYYERSLSATPSLSSQRRDILKHLEIKDKIKLLPLRQKEDVYSARHISKVSGNFERGKRR